MSTICNICFNGSGNTKHVAHEMMFGYKDEFIYIECVNCGCVQIEHYPGNLEKYYPSNYFAFVKRDIPSDNWINRYFRYKWITSALTGRGVIGRFIDKIKPAPELYRIFRKYKIGVESSVLDVGCGNGHFLINLYRAGFNNLVGIDPYLPKDVHYDDRLILLKKSLKDLDQQFDLITLHHSFEHMPEPSDVLHNLNKLLKKDGLLIIRIPIIGYSWRHYGVNWVGLDAPRHLFLHTQKSIEILSRRTGFNLVEISYDFDELHIWGSEQYKKGIPLTDEKSYWTNPRNAFFTERDIDLFKLKAKEMANDGNADQACFHFQKARSY